MSARSSVPGRSSTGRPREQSTIADSMPTAHGPPSSTSTSPPGNSSSTWRASVGLMRPKRLALGAATPATPSAAAASSSRRASGCAGQRRPIVSCPPAAAAAMPGARGTITVSGPGQKRSISRSAKGGMAAAKARAAAMPVTWTMSGWSAGRPLAA